MAAEMQINILNIRIYQLQQDTMIVDLYFSIIPEPESFVVFSAEQHKFFSEKMFVLRKECISRSIIVYNCQHKFIGKVDGLLKDFAAADDVDFFFVHQCGKSGVKGRECYNVVRDERLFCDHYIFPLRKRLSDGFECLSSHQNCVMNRHLFEALQIVGNMPRNCTILSNDPLAVHRRDENDLHRSLPGNRDSQLFKL